MRKLATIAKFKFREASNAQTVVTPPRISFFGSVLGKGRFVIAPFKQTL